MTNWIDRIKEFSILVIGDIMIDQYVTGRVDRVSPEAPVQVLTYESTKSCLGGAANVALNIRKLGAQVFLCGIIGADKEGEQVRKLCREEEIKTDLILVDSARHTTIKTRYMSGDQHLLRVDREDTNPITPSLSARLFEYIEHLTNSKQMDLVVFQDYDKGVLNETLIKAVIGLCQEKRIKTAADPKFINFWNYKEVDLFKPNIKEAAGAMNSVIPMNLDERKEMLKFIREKLNCQTMLMTLGSEGMVICDQNKFQSIDGLTIDVSDVCGAGDTVISIAAMALLCGLTLQEIGQWSNKAASWTCTKSGVVAITAETLKKL